MTFIFKTLDFCSIIVVIIITFTCSNNNNNCLAQSYNNHNNNNHQQQQQQYYRDRWNYTQNLPINKYHPTPSYYTTPSYYDSRHPRRYEQEQEAQRLDERQRQLQFQPQQPYNPLRDDGYDHRRYGQDHGHRHYHDSEDYYYRGPDRIEYKRVTNPPPGAVLQCWTCDDSIQSGELTCNSYRNTLKECSYHGKDVCINVIATDTQNPSLQLRQLKCANIFPEDLNGAVGHCINYGSLVDKKKVEFNRNVGRNTLWDLKICICNDRLGCNTAARPAFCSFSFSYFVLILVSCVMSFISVSV